MKKIMILFIAIIGLVPLFGCQYNMYSDFNKQLEEIEFEETGYIFFTPEDIYDGDKRYSLTEIFSQELVDNDTDYDFVNYHFSLVENTLFAVVNFDRDNDGTFYQAIIVYDFIEQKTLYFEKLAPKISVNNGNYQWEVDTWNNFLLYSDQDNSLSIYSLEGNTVNKEVITLTEKEDGLSYFFYQGILIRVKFMQGTIAIIDAYDYINKVEYNEEISTEVINETHATFVSYDGMQYRVYFGENLILTDEENNEFYKEDILTLYETSTVGEMVYDILKELNLESDPSHYDLYCSETDIYFTFIYERGILFNRNILGESPYLIFRFDPESETLKYIGLEERFVAVYKK